jgi:hypothetical protein
MQLPVMEVVPIKQVIKRDSFPPTPETFEIHVDSVLLKEPEESIFEIYPLQLRIPQGQSVCLYE